MHTMRVLNDAEPACLYPYLWLVRSQSRSDRLASAVLQGLSDPF